MSSMRSEEEQKELLLLQQQQQQQQQQRQRRQEQQQGFGSLMMTTLVPPLYISWRVLWANRMPIMDCDEVYNYWEPLYYLLNNDNVNVGSRGQQTWEYANEYALRTYAYIYPMKWAAQYVLIPLSSSFLQTTRNKWSLWQLLWDNNSIISEFASSSFDSTTTTTTTMSDDLYDDGNSMSHFLLLRAFLGFCIAISEVIWLYTLSEKLSRRHALWTGVLMLSGAGMNHSAAAYLPSSTWTMSWLLCSSCFLHQWYYTFCFLAVTSTLAIGWPFGVVLLIPMGLFILFTQDALSFSYQVRLLVLWTVVITAAIQGTVMYIDAQEYGRWTSATWNIFTYNAAGGGDELYGVEPVSYYVKNLLLNWNIVAPLAIFVMPCLVVLQLLGILQQKQHQLQQFGDLKNLIIPVLLAPLALWLSITVPRPHKEERFLFPIYPILCLGAVWAVDTSIGFLDSLLGTLSQRKQFKATIRMLLHIMLWTIVATVSLSRTMALAKYYSAPLSIYAQLAITTNSSKFNSNDLAISDQGETHSWMVCTCGEWYRFPSSFFLPKHTQLGFLKSSFTGQLPQPFSEFGSGPESLGVLQPFNNQNLDQPERYVNLEDCRWVIDLEESECMPRDSSKVIARAPFLDAARTSSVHRILYIPFWHERAMESGKVHYHNYVLAEL